MIYQPGQLGENDAQIFGALGHFDAGQFFDSEGVGPVVGHRTKIIEPIGIGHRAEVTGAFADLLVIAMQVTEDGLELAHDLAVKRDVHPEDTVG